MFKKTLIASSLLVLFSQAALAADTVRWLNDWLPAGDKAVIYLGVDKGLFADQGIEVEIASARGGSDVVTKLATASADFGSAGLASVLQARVPGADIKVVASKADLVPNTSDVDARVEDLVATVGDLL